MSQLKQIVIEVDNLTNKQQLDLISNLYEFSFKKLSGSTMLNITMVNKESCV